MGGRERDARLFFPDISSGKKGEKCFSASEKIVGERNIPNKMFVPSRLCVRPVCRLTILNHEADIYSRAAALVAVHVRTYARPRKTEAPPASVPPAPLFFQGLVCLKSFLLDPLLSREIYTLLSLSQSVYWC